MKQLNTYIVEKLKIDKNSEYESELDKEMKEWDKRMQSPFGQTLKELKKDVMITSILIIQKLKNY